MLQLPNGCTCSKPRLSKSKRCWRIVYRFYDPQFDKPKFVEVKAGLNRITNLTERKQAADALLLDELDKLQNRGYNPFTNTFIQEEFVYEIEPDLSFPLALTKAMERLDLEHHTKRDMRSVVRAVNKAAAQLRLANLPIKLVSRKHIKLCLEQCGRNSVQWSNHRFNLARAYLMMIFTELVELEASPANPVRDIKKKTTVKKIKAVATDEQRKKINDYLIEKDERFYHFVHLFYHSGGRKTELLSLKPSMVDLDRCVYKCTIKKGKKRREVERTIKEVAVKYWEYFLKDCAPDEYIFGTRFLPAEKPMGVDMPSRYWQQYVKKDLSIKVDFYSLKHLHTTELVDLLDEEAAAEHNKHTSTALVRSIYDVKQSNRQHERLRKAANEF